MMKSLWSGVGGLQAHQIAMDVEGNNIANVNTTGFKYSRTNFSDMLSQTSKIATSPQDPIGGKNALQVGLGVSVSTVTHIFSQGSIEHTEKNTDMAIQGDGMFVVSPDGGTTYKFTRAGNLTFDAFGNFTDTNGYIIQGWTRNDATKRIDNTQPINNIKISPGLTTPASATTNVTLKANLVSGSTTTEYAPTHVLDSDSATSAKTSIANGLQDPLSKNLVDKTNQQPEDFGVLFNTKGKAFNLQDGQGVWISSKPTFLGDSAITVGGGSMAASLAAAATGTQAVDITLNGIKITGAVAWSGTGGVGSVTGIMTNYINIVNQYTSQTGVTATLDPTGQFANYTNSNTLDGDYKKNISLTFNAANAFGGAAQPVAGTAQLAATAFKYQYAYNTSSINYASSVFATGGDPMTQVKKFKSTEDLRQQLQWQLRDSVSGNGSRGVSVSINSSGQFELRNTNDTLTSSSLMIATTAIQNSTSSSPMVNTLLTSTIKAFDGSLPIGTTTNPKQSLSVNAAVHSSGIDVFDSLGSKHTVNFTFRKVDAARTLSGGVQAGQNKWAFDAEVATPATFVETSNPQTYLPRDASKFEDGYITFNADGSFGLISPGSLNATWGNGSKGPQKISLEFGTNSAFDGLTSYDSPSATSLISQDGYTGGDLQSIRIDQNGVLVGSFTNGISYGLAQVGIAKFSNNEGLLAEGGNIYSMSSNSGSPTIGTPGSGGRGSIVSSALETSNVDLSRSLTELIVIQRGYQANSKTITTSDQMLQILLGLKQ
jgi:flagellar hook protein FlgE